MALVKDHTGNIFCNEKPENIKIVFTDLDGTMLDNETTLSETNLKSLIKAKEKGVKIIFATGRCVSSVKGLIGENVLKKYNISLYPGIYLNGCVVYDDKGCLLVKNALQEDIKMDILNFLKKNDLKKYAVWYDLETNYCIEHNEYTNSITKCKDTKPQVIEEEEIKNLTIFKVLLYVKPSNISDTFELFKKEFSSRANITNSFLTYIEIFNINANKFEAVKKICEFYNTSLDNVLACGDGDNDIQMLKGLENSVAVDNAPTIVKEAAKYISPRNDENGLTHILQAFCGL